MQSLHDPVALLSDLIDTARKAGADAADALLVDATSVSVQRRLGKIEHLERAEGQDLGLRVFIGKRAAIVSIGDLNPRGFTALAERAVAMARVLPEDPFGGLDAGAPAPDAAALELEDPTEPDTDSLLTRTEAAEDAAMAVKGVTNSEGAEAGFSRRRVALVTSTGFSGSYTRTGHSVSATALAGSGTTMERDYDYSSAVFLSDLEDAAAIGRRAGEQAVARLNPQRPKTARLPVVYHPRAASSLIGHLVSAINGAAVARGTSFLKEKLGTKIFADGITVFDDPVRKRGLRSRPFDGEGITGTSRKLIDAGMLTTWLLDTRSARQLGLTSTGHASRGTGGPPSPAATNLWLTAGTQTPRELMADIREGLFITELIGSGINMMTGDYSRGASGFMIRNGQLAEAVSEITVAGNLCDMFLNMTAANDLQFRRGVDSPTVRIENMTMAGASL